MRKTLFILITLLYLNSCISTKTKSQERWISLEESLMSEDWYNAFRQSSAILNDAESKDTNSRESAIVRYMYIITVSALMNERKITKEEAIQKVNACKNKPIATSSFGFLPRGKLGTNYITYTSDNDENDLSITHTNRNGTAIFAFQYCKFEKQLSEEEYDGLVGKRAYVFGIINNIEVQGNILPRFRIDQIKTELFFK